MVKGTLAVTCVFTLLATAYLTASLLILRPPRANYQQWTLVATAIVVQGVLTLIALFVSAQASLRYAALAGGFAIAVIGAWWVHSTLSGAHFEGYALILGSAMVVQGVLTLVAFLRSAQVSDTI